MILAIITAVCIVLALFGSYVVQIHYLCNHERTDRALRLMFSHYFIVIALNIITVSLKFLENPKSSSVFTAGLMIAGIILFYVTLFSNNTYYHGIFSFGKKDICYSTAVHLTGAVLMLLFNTKVYTLLLGAIIVTGGNFVTILMKYKSSMYLLKDKVDEGNL